VHGSALKGGVIAGCSDIDLQLFLTDAAFAPTGPLFLKKMTQLISILEQFSVVFTECFV
jgi:hypothetical protein